MKVKSVPRSWFNKSGLRLDCNPYMGGAIEAQVAIEQLSVKKQPLCDLTEGYKGGIYNGPMFKRNFVSSREYGVPFVSSGSMLKVELSGLPLLRKRDAFSNKLSYLKLKAGTTLISCSGVVGNMMYVRPDMDGVWSSQDVLKVVPDEEKMQPGYLFAYLSSKYGKPLITSGTYGAIITHLEPQHITELLVPRFNFSIEKEIHELVDSSARLRADSSILLKNAVAEFEKASGLKSLIKTDGATPYSVSIVNSDSIVKRFDGFFHSTYHREAYEEIGDDYKTVGELANSIVEPTRFKRTPLNDKAAIPFFGTSALMHSNPKPSYYLPRLQKGIEQYIVTEKTVLLPRSGQVSGIIGTAVLPAGDILGGAVSEDAIRINCESSEIAGYLYIALTSQHGLRQLKARTFGSSIPHLDVHQIGQVRLPNLSNDSILKIGSMGQSIAKMRHEAIQLEEQARKLVEETIEGAN